MIVLPVPNAGPDVTWIIVGFLLGFIGLMLLVAAWWQEATRNDRTDAQIVALWKAIPPRALPEPATEPIPAQPATEPSNLPLQVHAALLDEEWRARFTFKEGAE